MMTRRGDIIKAYKDGEIASDVARSLGVTRQYVSKVWKEEGLFFSSPSGCGVYILRSRSGKFYVGGSTQMGTRRNSHRSGRSNPGTPLRKAHDEEGPLEFKVLLRCRPEDLKFYEGLCIDRLKPELNLNRRRY